MQHVDTPVIAYAGRPHNWWNGPHGLELRPPFVTSLAPDSPCISRVRAGGVGRTGNFPFHPSIGSFAQGGRGHLAEFDGVAPAVPPHRSGAMLRRRLPVDACGHNYHRSRTRGSGPLTFCDETTALVCGLVRPSAAGPRTGSSALPFPSIPPLSRAGETFTTSYRCPRARTRTRSSALIASWP